MSVPQRLFIQVHRHSVSRSLPHRRAPRARQRQVRQVIPAFGLISPRLDPFITDGDSVKKTLAHTNSVDDSLERHRCMSHHGQRRENNSRHTSEGPRTSCRARPRFVSAGIHHPGSVIRNPLDCRLSRQQAAPGVELVAHAVNPVGARHHGPRRRQVIPVSAVL